MPEWLALSAIRGVLARGLKWLGGLNGYELLALALAILLAVDHIALIVSHRHAAKVEKQLSDAVAQMKAISTKRDTQRVITKNNIVTVTRTIHDADGKAKIVEQAPLPGNCKSSPEVLGADL